MAEWDTVALAERIVAAAHLSRGSRYQTIDSLLPLVDQHLRTLVVPELLKVAEDWLTSTVTYAVASGTDTYRLPYRCLRVLDVALLDASGCPQAWFSRATTEQVKQRRTHGWTRPTGVPQYWTMEANSLRLSPVPDAGATQYTLRVRFARRPGRLVDSAGTGVWVVTGIAGATLTISGSGNPENEPAFDLIRGTPGFESLGDDVVNLGGSGGGGTWTVDLEDTSSVTYGDYLAIPGTSPVPQVPLDYLAVLEMSVVEQILRNNGDAQGALSMAEAKVAAMASAQAVLEPRATENTVLVPAWDL